MPLALSSLDLGHGPPLLILHGLFGSARNWATIARRLADGGRHVHALDLRNHGASPWADTMRYPELAEDVRAYMAGRGLGSAAMVGHSMGGKAAMALALEHPDQVERLVVVDIAPVTYTHTHLSYVEAMRAIDVAAARRRSDVESQLAAVVPESGVRAFLLQNLVPADGGFRWRINLDVIAREMPALTGFPDVAGRSYAGKALFLSGARSDYVRPEHEDAIRRRFPFARIEMIPDAGHWVHAEQPERVIASITRFLDE